MMNAGFTRAEENNVRDEAYYGIFDKQGRIVFASPHFREVLGVDAGGKLSGINYGFFPLQETTRILEAIRQCMSGNDNSIRFEITTTEKEPRTFVWEIKPERDDQGSLTGIHCYGHDVTIQKATDKRLTILGEIIDRHISDIVFTVDDQFRILNMNQPSEALFGVTAFEAKGHRLTEFKHFSFVTPDPQKALNDIRTKGHFEGEVTYEGFQGRFVFNLITDAIRNETGDIEGYVHIARDISAKKENEERLRYFSTLLQHVSDAVITVDTRYDIVFVNRSAEMIYRVNAGTVIGRNFLDLYGNYGFEFRQTSMEQAVEAFQANNAWEGQISLQRPGQDSVELHVSLNPIRNLQGEVIGFISVNRDLTELMQEKSKLADTMNLAESAINNGLNPMAVLDLEGRVTRINEAAQQLSSKVSVEKRVSTYVWESPAYELTRENRDRIRDAVLRAAKGVPAVAFVDNVRPVGGELIPIVEFSVRPVLRDGVPIHLLFEYKPVPVSGVRTEGHQFQTENIFHSFMDNSPLPVWIVDRENRLISMNRYYQNAHGLTERDLGKDLFELVHTRHAQQYRRHNAQVLRTAQSLETIEYTEEQGVVHTYIVHKFPISNGTQVELIGAIAIDITANLQAEEKLKESHERYETVAKATNDLVWDMDVASGHITEIGNHAILWGRHTWHTRGYREMLGHIDEDQQETFDRSFKKALKVKTRDLWQFECGYKDPDGTAKTLLFRSIITRDDLGNAIRMTGSVQDISDRAKLQQELDQQREESHRAALRSQFEAQERERNRLAIELHDHINPLLAGASLHVDIAEQDPANRESYLLQTRSLIYECMQEIKKVSHHLSHHFLRDTNLEQAVRQVVDSMCSEEGPKVQYTFKGLELAPVDEYTKVNILRIFEEQVSNTINHAEAQQLDISLRCKFNKLQVVISDDGKGFEPSEHMDGIGLANIASRVESCNAKMKVTSAPGKGCRMEMEFPIKNPLL